MSNQTAHAALQRIALNAVKAARGQVVIYTATDGSEIELTAVKTRPGGDAVEVNETALLDSREWDWIVDPTELVDANAVAIEPLNGHTITTEDGTVYRLQPGQNADGKCWRWSDGLHTWRRVHTLEE